MNPDISINVSDALPYYTDKLLRVFGKDAETRTANARFVEMQQLALERASFIQCIGMPDPVPIERLYQPSRLQPRPASERGDEVSISSLIERGRSGVILAGPGRGKTTLLHWLFVSFIRDAHILPLLFTLRIPSAVDELADLVRWLTGSMKLKGLRDQLLFLVDGYDEISEDERKTVSKTLSTIKTKRQGTFLLTCRSFYNIPDIVASRYELAAFTTEDSRRFVEGFSHAIGAPIDGAQFCSELTARGFGDFVGHPLMLALTCVLKTGSLKSIPSNAIGLIRRALDTLTFRWDESKGLARDAESVVDGEVRQRCLMRIAFECERMPEKTEIVESFAREQLALEQCEGIDSRRVLDQMARWYGILVPTASGEWEFVHRALHDYLAARFWVESGRFNAAAIGRWSTRASYAACLLPDATSAICCALRLTTGLTGFIECLYNKAAFDNHSVAVALHRAFRETAGLVRTNSRDELRFSIQYEADFFGLAKTEFLREILSANAEYSDNRLVLAAYCFAELTSRNESVQRQSLPAYLCTFLDRDPLITVGRRDGEQRFRVLDCVAAD